MIGNISEGELLDLDGLGMPCCRLAHDGGSLHSQLRNPIGYVYIYVCDCVYNINIYIYVCFLNKNKENYNELND